VGCFFFSDDDRTRIADANASRLGFDHTPRFYRSDQSLALSRWRVTMGCEPQNPASERLEKGGSIGQREYVKLGSRGSHRDDFDRDRPGPILFLIGGCVLVFLALGGRRSGGHLLRGRVQDTIVDLASNVIRVGCVSPTRTSELCLADHGYAQHAVTPVPGRQNCLGEQRFRCSPSFAYLRLPLGGRPAPAPDCVAPCIHQRPLSHRSSWRPDYSFRPPGKRGGREPAQLLERLHRSASRRQIRRSIMLIMTSCLENRRFSERLSSAAHLT